MQPPQLSQQPTDSLSNALMLTCGTQLARKRWRLTVSMALGRSSNCPLGSVLLAPDGSSRSNTMLMAPWTATRPDWWPRAILRDLHSHCQILHHSHCPCFGCLGGPGTSLYGLKQAGRVWNQTLYSVLSSMGFKRVESDHGLYIFLRDDVRILMPVFVDDITLACKDGTKIDSFIQELSQHFKLRDLGFRMQPIDGP